MLSGKFLAPQVTSVLLLWLECLGFESGISLVF